MLRHLPIVLACLLLQACGGDEAGIEPAPAPDPDAPLAFIAPTDDLDIYDSDVAAYVLARGAGPSRISPDGSVIATRLSLTGTRQIYVMDPSAIDPKATLQQVTDGPGITFFEFSPDGSLIYGQDTDGDEREGYWRLSQTQNTWNYWGKPELILPATEQGFREFGGMSGDGRTLVYSSTERNGEDFDVYALDMGTREARLVYEGQGGNYVQAVSPSGATAILSQAVGEDADNLYVLNMASGERRVLSAPEPRANHTDAGVEYLDETRILLASNADREFAAIRVMVIGDTFSIGANAAPSRSHDIDSVTHCDGRTVATSNRDGFSVLHIEGRQKRVGLPAGVYDVDCAGDDLLVRVSAPGIPGDLYAMTLDGPARRIFASDYGELDKADLALPESVRLPARDGVEVQGLLYLPRDKPNPPVVFMVHGGPTAQARPTYSATAQYLLSKGIAVFQTNVRGSTGFGRTYTTLDDRERRLDSVRDLVDMLDYLEADGRVDTSRAAVMGGSYGGYLVNAVLADYPDAFDAGVSLFGVGDWVSALRVASPQLKASDIIEYGDIDEPRWQDFYARISPVAKADAIRVPVLYSHGAMDPRIDIAETEVMVRALRANGIRADYISIPDEGHGWRKLDNRLFYERAQAEFLQDVLGQ